MPASASVGAPAVLAIWATSLLLISATRPFLPARTIFENLPRRGACFFAPCAFIIFIICSCAFPESRIFFAIFLPERVFPQSSRSMPAILSDFSRSSFGASGSFFRTFITSIASSDGPMPFPIGWFPSLNITLTFIPKLFPSVSNLRFRMRPSRFVFILTCGPTGMSIRTLFAETEDFFAIIEARSIPCGSSDRGWRARIILSSADAKSTPPPHVMKPPTFFAICLSWGALFIMFARTSIVSAVPDGLVIALEEVFGIFIPAAVMIGMIIIVVLLPGTPPMQCLSATMALPNLSCWPFFTIAFVRSEVSLSESP